MKPMRVSAIARFYRLIWILTTALLFVSLACSISPLPLGQPTQAQPVVVQTSSAVQATPASTEQGILPGGIADSATPAVKLPPALVEADPAPRNELAPGAAPVFYFNQPMDRASVEAAFQTNPQGSGKLEWIRDDALRYVPAAPLSERGLSVTINTSAKAANGLALLAPVQITYSAAAPLRLAERLPAPDAVDINPSSAVVVTFTRPLVALGADTANQPPAFTLDPAVVGRGEWLNTSTYIFYPQPALLGGARYTVHLNGGLTSLDGLALTSDSPLEWSFSTAAPVLLSVTPGPEQPVALDTRFTLTFNQPMDTVSVQSALSLLPASGVPVGGTFAWNNTATEVVFQPGELLQRAATYTLALFGTASSQGGAPVGRDFAATITTVPQFGVAQTHPASGQSLDLFQGSGSLVLIFRSPVSEKQDFNRLITLSPAISGQNVSLSQDGYQLYVNGYFAPSTRYTLSISPDLLDRWNAPLIGGYRFNFNSQKATPQLTLAGQLPGWKTIFVPQNDVSLTAQSTNITRLALARGKLSLAEFLQAETKSGLQDWQSKVQASWAVLLYPTPDVTEPINIPLIQGNQLLTPGVYFLKIDTQPALGKAASDVPNLLLVSPIQMVVKISERQGFVWAVRIADNMPVIDTPVNIVNSSADVLGTCTTGADGTCSVDLPARPYDDQWAFAVIGQPGDANFSLASAAWNDGLASWDFQIPYQVDSIQPDVYLYTDRPIYRPGQTVSFRAVVRARQNGRYSLTDMDHLTLNIVNPYDPATGRSQNLASLPLALDAYGAAAGVYTLPDDARPGMYSLHLKDASQKDLYQDILFEVAQYRKPEVDLQVQFAQPNARLGTDLAAQVSAKYFFGAPAGNLPLHWTLFSTRAYVDLPGGFSVGKLDLGWMRPMNFGPSGQVYVMEGQTQTGPDGSAALTIAAQDLRDHLGDSVEDIQDLQLEATVTDANGLPVSARTQVRLFPADVSIGVRAEQWSAPANQPLTYTIRTIDWQNNPSGDLPLSAHFRKVTWVAQDSPDPYILPAYRMEFSEVSSTDFRTSVDGEARLAFTPPEPGTYMLEIKSADGALTQVLSWVSGAGSASWPLTPNQRMELRSDRGGAQPGQYNPGETAQIFIPNSFPDGALALISVERGKVMRSTVQPVTESSLTFSLPLTDEDAPNVFVSVTLLGRTAGRPDFRQGYIELVVQPTALVLQVETLMDPPQPAPGAPVTVNIRAKDAQGSPVQAEFSLAVVDKAALALAEPNAPAIVDAFYSRQPLGVLSGLSLAESADRFVAVPPGRGGGGDGAPVSAPIRSKWEDTAYWNGAIQTDANGAAQVTFTLPDNLTTWRADVRGVTMDTRVGQAAADVVVSKLLLVRPVTPRFVVVNDHMQMAAIVHNNTPAALQASVRLEGSGFSLDDPNLAVQKVDLPAGAAVTVTWWGTVQDVAALDLTFGAESGDLNDAARPQGGLLPVHSYSAPQTFGTSGVLSESGDRLEVVSLPRSFTPTGGSLQVELAPSLPAVVIDGLKALEAYPRDFTEPVISRLLPNVVTLQALADFQITNETLRVDLVNAITDGVGRIQRLQNDDGGWGWAAGSPSDAYLSSYALYALTRAGQAGVFVDPQTVQKAQDYLMANQVAAATNTPAWQMDRLAFQQFALQQAGRTDVALEGLYTYRDALSPWAKALLALSLQGQSAQDERAKTLISDLESAASRTASGASWQDASPPWHNWSTPIFTTSVVTYAAARLDPSSQVLLDAARYLVVNRRPNGVWGSSYESSWSLLALLETARATGDFKTNFSYAVNLNGAPMMNGKAENPVQATSPVEASVPLSQLLPDAPNALDIQRGDGSGRLYYRAYLRVNQPAENAPALQRGLSIERHYYRAGQNCRTELCVPLSVIDLNNQQPVLVRLTLTVPEDMYGVVVEDPIPAGTEVLNPRLKTSQQNLVPADPSASAIPFDLSNPFDQGWGWWLFGDPQVYDDHVRWAVNFLPAGTYELTYRLTPFLAGEYRLIPAHAWQYYFPEVEATSAGGILKIQ